MRSLKLPRSCLLPPNGGFVPDSAEGRSFVIKQIGGFVFQKTSALQVSVIRSLRPFPLSGLLRGVPGDLARIQPKTDNPFSISDIVAFRSPIEILPFVFNNIVASGPQKGSFSFKPCRTTIKAKAR
ncbi:MAG: hypothetical protein ACLQOO_31070 [Terriglobia bacterium]